MPKTFQLWVKITAMEIINMEALSKLLREAVRAELQEHFKTGNAQLAEERLLSKQELAAELGVSLVTLTDWMKKGLPYLRLHKRVYFKKSAVLLLMQQTDIAPGGTGKISP